MIGILKLIGEVLSIHNNQVWEGNVTDKQINPNSQEAQEFKDNTRNLTNGLIQHKGRDSMKIVPVMTPEIEQAKKTYIERRAAGLVASGYNNNLPMERRVELAKDLAKREFDRNLTNDRTNNIY